MIDEPTFDPRTFAPGPFDTAQPGADVPFQNPDSPDMQMFEDDLLTRLETLMKGFETFLRMRQQIARQRRGMRHG